MMELGEEIFAETTLGQTFFFVCLSLGYLWLVIMHYYRNTIVNMMKFIN